MKYLLVLAGVLTVAWAGGECSAPHFLRPVTPEHLSSDCYACGRVMLSFDQKYHPSSPSCNPREHPDDPDELCQRCCAEKYHLCFGHDDNLPDTNSYYIDDTGAHCECCSRNNDAAHCFQ